MVVLVVAFAFVLVLNRQEVKQSLTVAHETNELFKEAMAEGHADCDLIAVHPVIRKKKC